MMLTTAGHTIIGEADNGINALRQFRLLRPDLVILDLDMPEMDGYQVIEEFKQLDPDVRIIICSGVAEKESVKNVIRSGVKDYIIKPFTMERLQKSLQKAMAPLSSPSNDEDDLIDGNPFDDIASLFQKGPKLQVD